jgi:hypothetical protein
MFQEVVRAWGSPIGTLPETNLFEGMNSRTASEAYCSWSDHGSSATNDNCSTEDYPVILGNIRWDLNDEASKVNMADITDASQVTRPATI